MPLAGVIDFAEEAKRLDRELEKLGKEVTQAQRKMSNEDFLAKAPAEVILHPLGLRHKAKRV